MMLEGKVAIVTGGGTGIGAAVTKRFVDEGAKVVITGRRREKLDEVAATFPKDSVRIFCGDVCSEGNAQQIVEAALGFTGKLDILVNNAAIEENHPLVDMDPSVWREQLEINLTGPFLMMKAAIPKMIEAGGSSIINVASIAAIVAPPGAPAYCATKAAVIHLSKQVAVDYGKHNVRCNVVLPGPVRTNMLEMNVKPLGDVLHTDMDGIFERMSENVPLRRIVRPDGIAGLFAFLASEDSAYMTGAAVVIDGGVTIIDPFAAGVGHLGGAWG